MDPRTTEGFLRVLCMSLRGGGGVQAGVLRGRTGVQEVVLRRSFIWFCAYFLETRNVRNFPGPMGSRYRNVKRPRITQIDVSSRGWMCKDHPGPEARASAAKKNGRRLGL